MFRAQSVSKNKSICDCAEARPQSDRSTLLSNSLSLTANCLGGNEAIFSHFVLVMAFENTLALKREFDKTEEIV